MAVHTGKRCIAQAGAKNFLTVMPDAEIDRSTGNMMASFFGCTGQRCLAGSVAVAVGAADPLVARLAREAASRSHAMSAALFAGLARGRSFAPLHALATALQRGARGAALDAARRLVVLGHSSGWDMLTGFMLGMGIALSEDAK